MHRLHCGHVDVGRRGRERVRVDSDTSADDVPDGSTDGSANEFSDGKSDFVTDSAPYHVSDCVTDRSLCARKVQTPQGAQQGFKLCGLSCGFVQ